VPAHATRVQEPATKGGVAGAMADFNISKDNVKNFTNFSCTRRARLLNNALGLAVEKKNVSVRRF
jgi:hypothetical protein